MDPRHLAIPPRGLQESLWDRFFSHRTAELCACDRNFYIWHPDATLIKQNARGTAGDNRINCNRIPRAAVFDILPAPPGNSAGQKIALIATGLNAIFCPAESPGGTGRMSYTAARGILLQLTRLSPAVPCVLLNQGGIGMPYVRNFCPQAHNFAARREKIGPRAIPMICEAESPSGADPRHVNCNTWLKIN